MKRKIEEIERVEKIETNDFQIVEGELLEVSTGEEIESAAEEITRVSPRPKTKSRNPKAKNQKSHLQYFLLPFIFLTVALLGGLRLNAGDNAFLFLRPALVCLIFAAILLVLFFRAKLIKLDGWFPKNFPRSKTSLTALVWLLCFSLRRRFLIR